MRLIIIMCLFLMGCATPEGNERGRRFFSALQGVGQQISQSARENASVPPVQHTQPVNSYKPTQTDYRCKNNCMAAGYRLELCEKQCSY